MTRQAVPRGNPLARAVRPRARLLAAAAIAVAAGLLVTAGVALVYPPAGLVTAGVLLAASLFVDLDAPRRPRR